VSKMVTRGVGSFKTGEGLSGFPGAKRPLLPARGREEREDQPLRNEATGTMRLPTNR
jgi:hypothetical protein